MKHRMKIDAGNIFKYYFYFIFILFRNFYTLLSYIHGLIFMSIHYTLYNFTAISVRISEMVVVGSKKE